LSAFAVAMAALVADPNLGVEAVYRKGGTGAPIAPRVLRSGYLPGYLRDIGALRQDIALDELVRQAKVSDRARAVALDDPAFSARIREGVPAGRP